MNSKAVDFYYKKRFSTKKDIAFPEIQTYLYEQLPIPIAAKNEQKNIEDIVCKILNAKQSAPSTDTSALENEIDFMVYKLYGLTYDEVLVVDPETPIKRDDYERL